MIAGAGYGVRKVCTDQAERIDNIIQDMTRSYDNLIDNLKGFDPYKPNTGLDADQAGHIIKANAMKNNLIKRVRQFEDECGGGGPNGPHLPSGTTLLLSHLQTPYNLVFTASREL